MNNHQTHSTFKEKGDGDLSCNELPPVPEWWYNGGQKEFMERQAKSAAAFDKIISDGIKPR